MPKKMIFQLWIICCLLPIAACNNTSNTQESTSSQASVLPSSPDEQVTSSTTGATDSISIEEAAKQYSLIVRPFGCAWLKWIALEEKYASNGQFSSDNLPEFKDAAAETANLRNIAVEKLILSRWPQTVQSDIQAVALFWAAVQKVEKALSESTDARTWNMGKEVYRSKASSSETGLSKIIRIKLSLPEFSSSECG